MLYPGETFLNLPGKKWKLCPVLYEKIDQTPFIDGNDSSLVVGPVPTVITRKGVEKLDLLKNYDGPDFNLSISQGVAAFPENCNNLEKLKELADKALYAAKEGGRNMVIECEEICTKQ